MSRDSLLELGVVFAGGLVLLTHNDAYCAISYKQMTCSGRCPVCSSDEYEALAYSDKLSAVSGECSQCGFLFLGSKNMASIRDFTYLLPLFKLANKELIAQLSEQRGRKFG